MNSNPNDPKNPKEEEEPTTLTNEHSNRDQDNEDEEEDDEEEVFLKHMEDEELLNHKDDEEQPTDTAHAPRLLQDALKKGDVKADDSEEEEKKEEVSHVTKSHDHDSTKEDQVPLSPTKQHHHHARVRTYVCMEKQRKHPLYFYHKVSSLTPFILLYYYYSFI